MAKLEKNCSSWLYFCLVPKSLTEFKTVKLEIRQRQIKKLQAIQVCSRADQLDRNNQVDAAFFRETEGESQKNLHRGFKTFRKSNFQYSGRLR